MLTCSRWSVILILPSSKKKLHFGVLDSVRQSPSNNEARVQYGPYRLHSWPQIGIPSGAHVFLSPGFMLAHSGSPTKALDGCAMGPSRHYIMFYGFKVGYFVDLFSFILFSLSFYSFSGRVRGTI